MSVFGSRTVPPVIKGLQKIGFMCVQPGKLVQENHRWLRGGECCNEGLKDREGFEPVRWNRSEYRTFSGLLQGNSKILQLNPETGIVYAGEFKYDVCGKLVTYKVRFANASASQYSNKLRFGGVLFLV